MIILTFISDNVSNRSGIQIFICFILKSVSWYLLALNVKFFLIQDVVDLVRNGFIEETFLRHGLERNNTNWVDGVNEREVISYIKTTLLDLLGGPVVKNPPYKKKKKNPPYNARDMGLIPHQGTNIPHTTGQLSQSSLTTEPMQQWKPSAAKTKKKPMKNTLFIFILILNCFSYIPLIIRASLSILGIIIALMV